MSFSQSELHTALKVLRQIKQDLDNDGLYCASEIKAISQVIKLLLGELLDKDKVN